MDPIKIYVGCAANQEDLESQVVLEYSLKKYASKPLDITWMQLSKDSASPFYGWDTLQWATPFSGLRWAVPDLNGRKGKAIYMDSDFIPLADIAELWDTAFQAERDVISSDPYRFDCILWNCEKAATPSLVELKKDSGSHARMFHYYRKNATRVQTVDVDWDVLDHSPINWLNKKMKAIHYTVMQQQCQLKYALPRLKAEGRQHWYHLPVVVPHPDHELQALFDKLLQEAYAAGYTLEQYKQQPLYGEYSIRGKAA